METISVTITLAFADATDRNFKFNGVESSVLSSMATKVKAINSNMPAEFASTFTSDNGAQCVMISGLKSVTTSEEVIYSAS